MMNQSLTGSPGDGDTTVLRREAGLAGAASPLRRQTAWFALYIVGLSGLYAFPLYALADYSLHSEFFSYILLIPVISVYLARQKRPMMPAEIAPCWKWAVLPGVIGAALLAGCEWALRRGWRPPIEDYLTLMMTSYVFLVAAGCVGFFGRVMWKLIAFPVVFLVFMIPIPAQPLDAITLFFQHTSATAASWMLSATGTPYILDDLLLTLPGVPPIMVAPQCSGIHSTMVLLITSVLAGSLFLTSWWKRGFLVAFVLPLAIVRNGFRIYTIAELCVHVGPNMINSPIHHHGGPIFFILSLIPFFLILLWLRKSEPREAEPAGVAAKA
jgi:exosortase C (VPDSG-CTERM-specific)